MLFSVAFGVPEKSVFTRLFCVFASAMLANFQDLLPESRRNASISLQKAVASNCLLLFALLFGRKILRQVVRPRGDAVYHTAS